MNDKHWDRLYVNLETELAECAQSSCKEKEQVECAFKIAINFWEDIKAQLEGYVFEEDKDEIHFYKVIKPKFTSHIEYLTMVYQYLSFTPDENPDARMGYLQNEKKRLARFTEKHSEFVKYMKSGCTEMDLQYFLPANYDLARVIVSRVYNNDGAFLTSHDHLVAMLLAHEMYHDYVKMKIKL